MKRHLLVLCCLAVSFGVLQATEEAGDDIQDVLYTGEGRPALLRLHLRVDGRALFARWDGYIEKLFRFLDRNNSGDLDRTEAGRVPTPAQMQGYYQGNVAAFVRRTRTMANVSFGTLDVDNNSRVSQEELRDYYRKNGAGPVQLSTYPIYANMQDTLTETVFKLLDANKDGKLSKAELQAAMTQLVRYDSNDDELVSQQEVGGTGNPYMARQVSQPARPTPQTTSLVLISRENNGRRMTGRLSIARDLMTRLDKDKNNRLSQAECNFPADQFARVDRNEDTQLDVLELVRWLAGKPDGEFTLRLSNPGAAMVRKASGGVMARPAAVPKDTDMAITLGNVRLSVVPVGATYTQADNTRFVVQQFKQVDKENNGYVSRTRIGAEHVYLSPIFDVADRNGDARLTEEELKAFLTLVREGAGMQVSLTLSSTGQGLFQTLDADGDGQLSIREIRNAWHRVSAFDGDGDEAVSKTEFPQQFRLSVGTMPYYGFAVQSGFGDTVGTGPRRVTTRGPLWFRKMDTNADGDVSGREWLGTSAEFAGIDSDRDGLISVAEAEAADAKARRKTS